MIVDKAAPPPRRRSAKLITAIIAALLLAPLTEPAAAAEAVSDGRFVTIGGVPQWIQIRGEDRTNPVILFIHGGPGDAQSPLTRLYAPWTRDFTVAHWDQRGAGRTFGRGARLDVPMARMVQDGIEVTEHLRRELGVCRVILIGHSWGSVLGIQMIKARPDLFAAYVGTGQIVSFPEMLKRNYADALAAAAAAGDEKGVATLVAVGPPPYGDRKGYVVLQSLRLRYLDARDRAFMTGNGPDSEGGLLMASPDASGRDKLDWVGGLRAAGEAGPYAPLVATDLRALGRRFRTPVFIAQGADDRWTPVDQAAAYESWLRAPRKAFIRLEGGHFTAMTDPAGFHNMLTRRVRALALTPAARHCAPPSGRQ